MNRLQIEAVTAAARRSPALAQAQTPLSDSADEEAHTSPPVPPPVPPPVLPPVHPPASADGSAATTETSNAPLARSLSAGSSGFSAFLTAAASSMSISSAPSQDYAPTNSDAAADELIQRVQRLCQRQRQRSEERAFVRDVERILALLRRPASRPSSPALTPTSSSMIVVSDTARADRSASTSSATAAAAAAAGPPLLGRASSVPLGSPGTVGLRSPTSTALAATDFAALFECTADLFDHRNPDVRALAFELLILCARRYASHFQPTLRRQLFRRIENHKKDFQWRQAALRALTDDGRDLEPFRVELGWLLLQLLEQSTAQLDLLALIQDMLHHSAQALGTETAAAITDVVCTRCDHAWSRGDIDTCKRFLAFFHVLATTGGLEYVASASGCLRSLCCLVNADGHGTWSVLKNLLGGAAGFHVLRGLINLLESPHAHSQWVLRGAVFFVGMSCWGSQRIAKFDDVKWAPVLLSLEHALECDNGVVVFEVILALQRLIKKFGPKTSSPEERRLVVEWSIILRMLLALRPWLASVDENDNNGGAGADYSDTTSSSDGEVHQSLSVSIQQTRMPKELLDTIALVEDLVAQDQFAGEPAEFFAVLEEYLPYLGTPSKLFILQYRADAAYPGAHTQWLPNLANLMHLFFADETMLVDVRLEALAVLQKNLAVSRHVNEDRVIDDVLIPSLEHVYDDPHDEVRLRGIDMLIDVARHLESVKFESLLDVLATAVAFARYEDAQERAAAGIASLFESWFDHLPSSRALRMYETLTNTAEAHRNANVRRIALKCLLSVCEATSDFHLQWREFNGHKDSEVPRVSRFLLCARAAVPRTAVQTGGVVPVGRGLRALLTLVSTETHAELFRMAVSGLQRMLVNRSVLCDVDISEVALKVISSVSYQAFGRTAVADEAARLLRSQTTSPPSNDPSTSVTCSDSLEEQASRIAAMKTDAEMVRSIYAVTRHHHQSDARLVIDSGLLSTATMLAKTSFLALGIDVLSLLASYAADLHSSALQQLTRCFLDVLGARLVVAEKDVFGGTSSTMSSGSKKELDIAHHGSDIGTDDHGRLGTMLPPVVISAPHGAAHIRNNFEDGGGDVFASEATLGFTARVLSRFHPGTTPQGGFFQSLTGSKSTSTAQNAANNLQDRQDRGRMQTLLRQLFQQEFKLILSASNTLSLLALKAPDVIRSHLPVIVQAARTGFTTIEGDFRADAFGAVIEMLSNLVTAFHGVDVDPAKDIIGILLLGFEYAKSKHVSYLSFRLLCRLIYSSTPHDRIILASVALPGLEQCAHHFNSLLLESAIDFLMCHAYACSSLVSASLCNQHRFAGEPNKVVDSRTWLYKNSLLTISTYKLGAAMLTVRRANLTSSWQLRQHEGGLVDPNAFDFDAKGVVDNSHVKSTTLLSDRRALDDRGAYKIGARSPPMARSLPARPFQRSGKLRETARRDGRGKPTRLNIHGVDSNMFSPSASSPVLSESGTPAKPTMLRRTLSFPSSTSLPPLPAYDGVGGSPSYFVESSHALEKEAARVAVRPVHLEEDAVAIDVDELDTFSLDTGFKESAERQHLNGPKSAPTAASRSDEDSTFEFMDDRRHIESSQDRRLDPMYLMMQLFDVTSDKRPQMLTSGPTLTLALNVLDRTPEYETHKIGVLYVRSAKQKAESAVLGNVGGSLQYLRFLRGLGSFVKLEGLSGYSGGLDTAINSDGKWGLVYKDNHAQIVFHVATMMVPDVYAGSGSSRTRSGEDSAFPGGATATALKKKRHIGNDFVHVIFKETDADYDERTLSGQFNDVHIIVQPLGDDVCRTEVRCKPGIAPFGPLFGTQMVATSAVAESVRLTCLNANLACQAFHQDLVGFHPNCEERLKQIKQLGMRASAGEDWLIES